MNHEKTAISARVHMFSFGASGREIQNTPEIVYRVTSYRVKSLVGLIYPGTNRVNEVEDSIVDWVVSDIG